MSLIMSVDSSDEHEPCCSPELKKSNLRIFQNIAVCLLGFYCTYFAMAAVMHGVFDVQSKFDGRQPFNFSTISDLDFSTDAKESIASFMSMELTYFCTTFIISFYLTAKVWDYAITITFVHLLLSCVVMVEFPVTWQWWCAIGIGLLWMITMGETMIFFLRRRNARRAIEQSLNLPPLVDNDKNGGPS